MKNVVYYRPWRLCFALLALVFTSSSAVSATSEDARAVARLYSAAFDREPDLKGLNFWIHSLDQGQTLQQLARNFRDSPEFARRYGDLDDDAYVRQLYRNVLGREGEASGVAFWVDTLESGGSQAQVLRQFSQSPENRRKTDDLFAEMHQGADDRWSYAPVSGPVKSIGTIDGFGSIFVNGIEFETSGARISLDGQVASEDSLRLGMVVTVDGTINDDGTTGTATSVLFDDEVQGPITELTRGQDGDSLTLRILGVEVIAERTGTVFEDTSFATLATGDLVEVSGFLDDRGRLRATRVEKKTATGNNEFEIELKGIVAALTGNHFTLNGYQVDFSGADLSAITGGVPTEGIGVEVHGTLLNGTIMADRVAAEDSIAGRFSDDDEVHMEGSIGGFAGIGRFQINGITVDGSSALLRPADLVLADGVVVAAEGNWAGEVLVARKIEARRGRVEIEATVLSVDTDTGLLLLGLPGGTVSVRVDSRTLLDDNSGQDSRLSLADIVSGNFLEVEAIRAGDVLLATRINRDNPDDVRVQGPVSAFTPGVDITLLGVTFSTAGARFESRAGNSLSESAFFGQLRVGDLVKIKDENPADGVADEVEFEHAHALDGDECESDDDCDDSGRDDDSDHGGGSDDPPGDDSGHGGGSDDSPGDDSGHGDGSDDSPGDDSDHGGGSDDPPGDDSGHGGGSDDSPDEDSGHGGGSDDSAEDNSGYGGGDDS